MVLTAFDLMREATPSLKSSSVGRTQKNQVRYELNNKYSPLNTKNGTYSDLPDTTSTDYVVL